jgi:hypothetical protein
MAMAHDNHSNPDRENKWSPDRRRDNGAAGRGGRRGYSGYGMDSIRPHLRAQLEQHRLLRPNFPPDEPDKSSNADC